MNISTKADGADAHSHNPILVGFFQEIRRLAEELTRREQAAAMQACENGATEQSTGYDTQTPARRFKLSASPPAATGSLFSY